MPRLTDLKVSFISLVEKPANKLDIVYKCRDKFNSEKLIKITKASDEGLVSGIVYQPLVKDADGDWADAETIKKASHDFLSSGRNFNIDENHSEKPAGASVVESSLDEKGAWKVVLKMDPASETFQKVKKGEYKGLSMMATCHKKDEEPSASTDPANADLAALKDEIAKQAKTIEELTCIVKGIPKSRQLTIDAAGKVIIEKSDSSEEPVLSEFNFANLN